MPQWPHIYSEVLKTPYEEGRSSLCVITGYSSSAFVHHLLHAYDRVQIDLILGMVKQQPITIWDHNEYIRLVQDTGRLRVRYYKGTPPIHMKAVLWKAEHGKPEIAYAGSSNLTWHGFRDYQELMISVDPREILNAFPDDHMLKDCVDPDIFEHFNMLYQREPEISEIDTSAIGAIAKNCPSVILRLTQKRDNQVHDRSGLNWGQRERREPNQAYIPISSEIHKEDPEFFPDLAVEFTVITDDGESFVCTVAQQGRKAIHTNHDNSILGRYFRRRLGVASGAKVERLHLERYGRDSVTIYKMNDDTYYMDFSQRRG
ncbi:restriction endonuclease PLD domain-containing protein [Paenibacillus amylolyticus]|nr:restriction endonuclease PLD domain-containing protein [Paenibacillus amylolyticus]